MQVWSLYTSKRFLYNWNITKIWRRQQNIYRRRNTRFIPEPLRWDRGQNVAAFRPDSQNGSGIKTFYIVGNLIRAKWSVFGNTHVFAKLFSFVFAPGYLISDATFPAPLPPPHPPAFSIIYYLLFQSRSFSVWLNIFVISSFLIVYFLNIS